MEVPARRPGSAAQYFGMKYPQYRQLFGTAALPGMEGGRGGGVGRQVSAAGSSTSIGCPTRRVTSAFPVLGWLIGVVQHWCGPSSGHWELA